MGKKSNFWDVASRVERLRELAGLGLANNEIATKMGTTTSAVRSKKGRLKKAGDWNVYEGPVDLPGVPARELFTFLKNRQRSVGELCKKFDRSPETVQEWLAAMKETGYALLETRDKVAISTAVRTQVPTPAGTLADKVGMVIPLGIISDKHSGSRYAQPSAIAKCVDIMTNEYGVQHIVDPGDVTAGIYGFRGQEFELIPTAVPMSRKLAHKATEAQVQIADSYTPKVDGVIWYQLGGNHDWWHVVNAGLDPVKMLADRREDIEYLGYDVNGLWLTDKVYVRLWHPSGGVPYAKSYRLQKGIETQSSEALKAANESAAEVNRILVEEQESFVAKNSNQADLKKAMRRISEVRTAVTSVLIAGHLHISIFMPEPPLIGLHPGCFEGKSGYLKRKGLEPAIGGVVLRFLVTDSGEVQRVEHTWIGFNEIEDDWKNYPEPLADGMIDDARELETLYRFEPMEPGQRFPIEDPRKGLGPGGSEYVGGK